MAHRRSDAAAQCWDQLDLLHEDQGVEARHGHGHGQLGGGGYLNGCTSSEAAKGASKKFARFSKVAASGENRTLPVDSRESALLDELDAMGLSRVMLQVAHAIGFDAFMVMWRILDGANEAIADNDSGIYIRLQRLSAYKRYQRNRFIEALAAMGLSHPEISRSVKRDLGEKVSDRHIWRLMAPGRVKA
jgi:hypothetical protein